jgi:hypothetical protein
MTVVVFAGPTVGVTWAGPAVARDAALSSPALAEVGLGVIADIVGAGATALAVVVARTPLAADVADFAAQPDSASAPAMNKVDTVTAAALRMTLTNRASEPDAQKTRPGSDRLRSHP